MLRRRRSTRRQVHPLEIRPPHYAVELPPAPFRGADVLGVLLVLYSLGTLAWMAWRTWPALEALTH